MAAILRALRPGPPFLTRPIHRWLGRLSSLRHTEKVRYLEVRGPRDRRGLCQKRGEEAQKGSRVVCVSFFFLGTPTKRVVLLFPLSKPQTWGTLEKDTPSELPYQPQLTSLHG